MWVEQCIIISVLRALYTLQCTFSTATQSPHHRDPSSAIYPLCHLLTGILLPLHYCLFDWPCSSHITSYSRTTAHGTLQIFPFPIAESSPVFCSHHSVSPSLSFLLTLLFAPSTNASRLALYYEQHETTTLHMYNLSCFYFFSYLVQLLAAVHTSSSIPSTLKELICIWELLHLFIYLFRSIYLAAAVSQCFFMPDSFVNGIALLSVIELMTLSCAISNARINTFKFSKQQNHAKLTLLMSHLVYWKISFTGWRNPSLIYHRSFITQFGPVL